MSSDAVQPIVALLSDLPGGNPTQYMIEKAFAHHDLDWRYLTVEVHPNDLAAAVGGLRAMGFRGGHCGNPHKNAALPLMDRNTETAEMIGAVNLILREGDALIGDNTEGKGLALALGRVTDLKEKRLVLLGAGNVGRAAGVELAAAEPAEIVVVDRTEEHARRLADLLAEKFPVAATPAVWEGNYEVPAETDVLINATSIGRKDPDAAVPVNLDGLRPEMIVADMTTDPPQTWLLREAAQRRCTVLDGLGMYIDQVAIGIKAWTGVDPNGAVMREAIEEFLEL